MRGSWLFRLKAAAWHVLGSATVIGLFLWLIYGYWYPHPHEIVLSTMDVVKILVAVDLILGPLLTFVVFNPDKQRQELVRDLGVIVGVQIAALMWGMYVTYSMRPQFLVYYENDVYVLTARDVDMSVVPDNIVPRTFLAPPVAVFAQGPQTAEEITRFVKETFADGKPDVPLRPEFYRPYAAHQEGVRQSGLKVAEREQLDANGKAWLERFQGDDGVIVLNLRSGNFQTLAVCDWRSGTLLFIQPR